MHRAIQLATYSQMPGFICRLDVWMEIYAGEPADTTLMSNIWCVYHLSKSSEMYININECASCVKPDFKCWCNLLPAVCWNETAFSSPGRCFGLDANLDCGVPRHNTRPEIKYRMHMAYIHLPGGVFLISYRVRMATRTNQEREFPSRVGQWYFPCS